MKGIMAVIRKHEVAHSENCPDCGKTYETRITFLDGRVLPCKECRLVRHREASKTCQEEKRREWAVKASDFLYKCGVPLKLKECSMENFVGELPPCRPGLVIGPVGVGKTHLAIGYMRQALLKYGPHRVLLLREVDFADMLRDTFKERSEKSTADVMARLNRMDFLVVDDLGKANPSPLLREALYNLIDYRQSQGHATIITSNLELQGLLARHGTEYADSLISRIMEMGGVWKLDGDDWRLANLTKKG
jgi:DNA replication protein DnaC